MGYIEKDVLDRKGPVSGLLDFPNIHRYSFPLYLIVTCGQNLSLNGLKICSSRAKYVAVELVSPNHHRMSPKVSLTAQGSNENLIIGRHQLGLRRHYTPGDYLKYPDWQD